MPFEVLHKYGLDEKTTEVIPFGKGLINNTWKVVSGDKAYILQRINENVFKQPQDIADNIKLINDYLTLHHPAYNFVAPIPSVSGNEMIYVKDQGCFRLFPFIQGSHTIDVVETPEQAYEAASQFGKFTRLLSGFDTTKLKTTIPGFHDLSWRHRQFIEALRNGNKERIKESNDIILALAGNTVIINKYERLKADPAFLMRVTHHDAKISNVLFDKNDKGLCVIDLDTVMPGYFISDVGDMMRTYLSPVSEEETDLDKIEIREDFYQAIVNGYIDEMKDELTERENDHFLFAGEFIVYMQALRFLADYINDDIYYGSKYPGHNLMRARNQLKLLERLSEKNYRG